MRNSDEGKKTFLEDKFLHGSAEMKTPQNTDNDSGDEASCSSTASIDYHANLRARSQRARNVSEKKRRDRLNMYINQLASLLPPEGHQKMDKSSILKHSVEYLKWQNNASAWSEGDKGVASNCFFSSEDLGLLIKELINGFIMTISNTGKIIYVADFVKILLGIDHESILGQSVESLVHPDDIKDVLKGLNIGNVKNNHLNTSGKFQDQLEDVDSVEFTFRSNVSSEEKNNMDYLELCCLGFWSEELSKEPSHEEDKKQLNLLVWPKKNEHLIDKTSSTVSASFSTQLSMDGKFLLIDASCSLLIGYLPYELLNTSMYFYVHESDLEYVVKLHKSLMNSSDVGPVMAFFRFRSKSDEWLLLKTILRVTYNPMTEKPEFMHAHFAPATQAETLRYNKLNTSSSSNRHSIDVMKISESVQSKGNQMEETLAASQAESPTAVSNSTTEHQTDKKPTSCSPLQESSNSSNDSKATAFSGKDKVKPMDAPKDVEGALQSQLKKKLETLSQSISKQKYKLIAMLEIMQSVQHELKQTESMQMQQNYQSQIYEHLKSNIDEQEKQCHKLRIILDGKIKVSETKRLAMELREKSKLVKSVVETGEKGRYRTNKEDSLLTKKDETDVTSTFSRYNKMLPRPVDQNSSVQSPATKLGYQEYPILKRAISEAGLEKDVDMSCTTEREDPSSLNPPAGDSQEQQSLQRQLQQLQHQQEVLNAQGMVLATQGNLPCSQIQLLQFILRQQQGNKSQEQQAIAANCAATSTATVTATQSSGYPFSPDRYSTDGNADFVHARQQRQQNYQPSSKQLLTGSATPIPNPLLQHISESNINFQRAADGSLLIDPNNPQSQEILLQLQRLQVQLQIQMQVLAGQQHNDDQQKQSIAQVVQYMQQLQQIQLGLLQQKMETSDANEAPKQLHPNVEAITRPDDRPGSFSGNVNDSSGAYLNSCSSPRESAVRFQKPYSPKEPCSPYMNMNYAKNSMQRQCSIEQGQPSEFRVPPSPTGSYCSSQYGIPQSSSQNSPLPISCDYTRASGKISIGRASPTHIGSPYTRNEQSMAITSQSLPGRDYRCSASSDGMESYINMSVGSNISASSDMALHNVPMSNQDNRDANSSAEKKEKKMEDDDLYDYIQTLPGQTQQLMQLHQAQRVHIIRMQQQQLHTLQQNHLRQPEQQQQQQQRPFPSMPTEAERCVQTDCSPASSLSGYRQEHVNTALPENSGNQSSGSQDNWQNDLQADQIVAMSDFDMLELLNGQHAWGFDEDDEQVLDLLIAEGADNFAI